MSDFLNDKDLNTLNHSCAHVLAQAVKHLYPQAKFWVGPVVEEGFYYDIDLGDQTISDDDLPKIEKEMKKICKDGKRIVRHEVSKEEALEEFKDDEYKLDLINGLEDGTITTYSQGDFTDLCRGPHVETVKLCKNFKLIKHSGAYWKGDKNNKVLQRIYGVCFPTKEELEAHIQLLEEAKERDHRKLGKELGIFMFADIVGKGLPMWLPNGFTVRRLLSDYIMNKELELGYEHVMTPSLGNVKLYKKSGHWAHYKDDMFPAMELDDEAYVLRPMNCPHHMVMYKSTLHSYRDLPVRIAEIANDFRFEASGALTGIERARAFTQNDSHIFCRPDQIAQEFKNVAHLILDVYKDFGFKDYSFRLSLRDKNNKEKYFGNDELWEKSENELREVLKEMNVEFYEAEGEAAFYGPKLDFMVKDAIGRRWQLGTIQVDYNLPERFELEYMGSDNQKHRPVMIHRAPFGSMERFVAVLIEHTAGKFPLWLTPEQVVILPISEKFNEYAEQVKMYLKIHEIRAIVDDRNEKIGRKIRDNEMKRIPYMLIVGEKEAENGEVSVRRQGEGDKGTMKFEEFAKILNEEVQNMINKW